MFGGTGGKAIPFSAQQNDASPPSYNEDEPDSAPSNPKKRLRQNSQAASTDLLASILAELKELRIAHSLIQSENAKLKKRLGAVESHVEQLQDIDDDGASTNLESIDGRLLELDENLDELTQRVQALEEHNQDSDDKAKLKEEIIDEIATRLWTH
jgi:chromosome segregation ATPase